MSAATVHSKRFIMQCLENKIRYYPSVVNSHARAVGIEYPDYPGIYLVHTMICHGHGLGKTFGFVVATAHPYRIYMAPVTFRLRVHQRVSVDLRS